MVKNPSAKAEAVGDTALIPVLGKFPEGGNGNTLQYFCLENPMTEEPGSPWGCKELDMTEY